MNWTFIESLAVTLAISILKLATHNPATAKAEGSIINQIAVAATEADTVANGNTWTVTPPSPAPTA
jgi:hypothetical protein